MGRAERIAAIAAEQAGRVALAQLVAAEISPSTVRRMAANGTLHRLHAGVYAVGHRGVPPLGDEFAALLAIGLPIALSHCSSGFVWEMWPAAPPAVEVLVLGDRAKSRVGIRVHRTRSLAPVDLRWRYGLPLTSPERTLLDLADHHEPRTVERAFDEAMARRLISRTKVLALLERCPGRIGGPLLAALADPARAPGVTREAAEERLLMMIRAAELPDPERNVPIGPYTVDMLWREAGVVVEVDSFTWHSGPAAFKRDRRKDAYLSDRGLTVHRVTWEMMDSPLPLIARLARAVTAVRG